MSNRLYVADKPTLDEIKKKVDVIALSLGVPGLTSWSEVQQIVRAGQASNYFSVGDQLASAYLGGIITWTVIGINVDTPVDSGHTHSLTLQVGDCLSNIQFDAPEPSNTNTSRKQYGNNRYIHSAVRQWLNSKANPSGWKSQHQYDAPPTADLDLYNGAGFLGRLDPDLIAVLGAVNKRVARASVDGGGQDLFSDKVFLLSQLEVDLGTEGTTTGEFVYPYYRDKGNANRIKSLAGTAQLWWLRSPNVSDSDYVKAVDTSGSLNYNRALLSCRLAPACCII